MGKDLIPMGDAPRPAGLGRADYAIAFIVNIAATTGRSRELFVYGEISVAAATGFYATVVGRQIITMIVAAAAGINVQCSRRTADIGIRTSALMDRQIFYIQFPMQIAAAGKIHLELGRVDRVLHIDIGAAGSNKLVDIPDRDIRFHMPVAPATPVKIVIIDIDLENAVLDFHQDLVANFEVFRTDGYGLFGSLAKIEIDAAGDMHAMKATGGAFLSMAIVDDFSVLRYGNQGGQGKSRNE